MTHFEQLYMQWKTVCDQILANGGNSLGVASKVLDAIGAYQPYDFMPQRNFSATKRAWLDAPKSTCRSLAIAALAEIEAAFVEYHADITDKNVDKSTFSQ